MDPLREAFDILRVTEQRLRQPRVIREREVIEETDIPMQSIKRGNIQGSSFLVKDPGVRRINIKFF